MEEIHYGNINREYAKYLNVENIFTAYKNEFLNNSYPNFYTSVKELDVIKDVQNKAMNSPEWKSIEKFCYQWDGDLIESFGMALNKMKIPANEQYLEYLSEVSEDLGALIMQLKNYFQRARPYQIAYYSNNLEYHPYDTLSGNSPSYPSGHACQGFFLCNVISNHYPEKSKELLSLANKIAESRVIMGIHFPSDNRFGQQIAKDLVLKKDIKDKYLSDEEEENVENE